MSGLHSFRVDRMLVVGIALFAATAGMGCVAVTSGEQDAIAEVARLRQAGDVDGALGAFDAFAAEAGSDEAGRACLRDWIAELGARDHLRGAVALLVSERYDEARAGLVRALAIAPPEGPVARQAAVLLADLDALRAEGRP